MGNAIYQDKKIRQRNNQYQITLSTATFYNINSNHANNLWYTHRKLRKNNIEIPEQVPKCISHDNAAKMLMLLGHLGETKKDKRK